MRYPAAAQLPTVSTTSAGRGPGAAQGPPFTILRSDLLLRMHCYPTFTLPPPMAPSRDVLVRIPPVTPRRGAKHPGKCG